MSTHPAPAIEIAGLRKQYGDRTVLDGLDLTVPAGTVTALLGPNGAGKTTTVSILSTLLPADGGTARDGTPFLVKSSSLGPTMEISGME